VNPQATGEGAEAPLLLPFFICPNWTRDPCGLLMPKSPREIIAVFIADIFL
jgi:hypothetical protein